MLESLLVRNIALIDEVSVPFFPGLNVLTGETGAGKSLLVDSLMLLLGGKAQKELIRTGCEKAMVEGVFSLDDCAPAISFMEQNDIDSEDGVVFLSREINTAGRSVCRVCGTMLPLSKYRELTARLMDIHGQHEHQSLTDKKNHLILLDAFGDPQHRALLDQMTQDYQRYKEAVRALDALRGELEQRQAHMDKLTAERNELRDAKLVLGEEEYLQKERDMNRHAEKIEARLRAAYTEIYDGNVPALSAIKTAQKAMSDIAGLDTGFAALSERLLSAYYEVEDIGITLRQSLDALNLDPAHMEEIASRLDLLRRLSRKYGATTEEMLAHLTRVEQDLNVMENADEALNKLQKQADACRAACEKTAARLTMERQKLKTILEKAIERQLSDLNMQGTRFVVTLQERQLGASGADTCEFMISPNRGEALKPLSSTASGGELSRLMLAVKSVFAQQSLIPAMVFDEIDTGISGRTAQVVAEKMAHIAHTRQVLCVTHLTQIAAMADEQYLIEKVFNGERTTTSLTHLDEDGRVHELARMLSGAGGEAGSAIDHAKALLDQAAQLRRA